MSFQELISLSSERVLPLAFRRNLIIPITLQEIDNALFSIDGTKAHGFNAKFFIETCHVIKPDIYAAVSDFF